MDFMDRITDHINEHIDMEMKIGYLEVGESLVIHALPGGRVVNEFYDGEKDENLNYEIVMRSKEQKKINDTLFEIEELLENTTELESNDGSFDFESINITNKPFLNAFNEQGWFVFLLDFTARLTTYEKKGIKKHG